MIAPVIHRGVARHVVVAALFVALVAAMLAVHFAARARGGRGLAAASGSPPRPCCAREAVTGSGGRVLVVGDSYSAGLGLDDPISSWPSRLAGRVHVAGLLRVRLQPARQQLRRRLVRDPRPGRGRSAPTWWSSRAASTTTTSRRRDPGRLRPADGRAARGTASSWSARRPRRRAPPPYPRGRAARRPRPRSTAPRTSARPAGRCPTSTTASTSPPPATAPSGTAWPGDRRPRLTPIVREAILVRWQSSPVGGRIASRRGRHSGSAALTRRRARRGQTRTAFLGVGEQVVGDRAADDGGSPTRRGRPGRAAPRGTGRGPGRRASRRAAGGSRGDPLLGRLDAGRVPTRSRDASQAAGPRRGPRPRRRTCQQRADQPDGAVRVGAGAAPLDQAGQLGRPAPARRGPSRTAPTAPASAGSPLKHGPQRPALWPAR